MKNLKIKPQILITTLILFVAFLVGGLSQNALYTAKALEPNDLFSNFTSQSTILMHADSKQVLYGKNQHQKMQVASITKLMTTLITLEKIEEGVLSLDDMIIASEYAASMEGSQAFLDEGSSYKVRDLLKSVIVASANDSSVALAEAIAGNEKEFVNLMNKRAQELKMTNTKYANSTGLPSPDQYSTAYDSALLLREVSKHQLYNEDSKIWMDEFIHPSGRKTELVNTNRLVKFYNHAINGKTGFTDEAGYCLVSSASNKGLNLIAVTLKCNSSQNRFKESMELFNYGFANYEHKQVLNKEEKIEKTVRVANGKVENLELIPQESFYAINKKGKSGNISINYELPSKVYAPIEEGDIVGKCLIVEDGKVIGEINIVAGKSVGKQTYYDSIKKLINNWMF